MALQATRSEKADLAEALDRVLTRGLVINADISIRVDGTELLGIKLRAAVASFETAAKYGMEFPGGTDLKQEAFEEARRTTEECPDCGKEAEKQKLLEECCPWCGWQSARAKKLQSNSEDSEVG